MEVSVLPALSFSAGGSEIRPYRIRPRSRGGRGATARPAFCRRSVGPHLRGGRYPDGSSVLPALSFSAGGSEIRPYQIHPPNIRPNRIRSGHGARDTKASSSRGLHRGRGARLQSNRFRRGLVGPHLRGGRYPGEELGDPLLLSFEADELCSQLTRKMLRR
jgi:hypothetical protein